ncbi:MAG: phosphotransferase [Thiofilum sp.]|uniref:phosphotransferase n=1 Tax=Thiofilum sp. TaxID=2212733 RepID=UPI0025F4D3AB|nr:phosphotransferase [Thiofilum sp.]MBK8454606.1 phosphotransferase [Thiofilum sp.]
MTPTLSMRLHTWLHATLQAPCVLQPLIGGSSNALYRVECQQHAYVLRVNAPSDIAFSVNRQCEAKVLDLIQPYPWAVQVIRNDVAQGLCLMQTYTPVTQSLSAVGLGQVYEAIHALQSIAIASHDLPLLTIDYTALTAQYQQQLDQFPHLRAAQWLQEWQQGLTALPPLPPVLVHQDLHAGNLCWNTVEPRQLILIDWEYAGLGNAWFDAVPLHNWGFSEAQLRSLTAFQHLTTRQWREGLQQAKHLIQVLTDLWYWARSHAQER